jgi:hypothetical protein
MPIRCACEQRRLASVEIDPRPMLGGQQFIANPVERAKNRSKSKVRAKVEHSIGVIKHVFGFAKVRYRGLKKNERRLIVTCALANLFIVPDSTPATIAIRRGVICLICGKHRGRRPNPIKRPHSQPVDSLRRPPRTSATPLCHAISPYSDVP